jgi:c-di-GMP-binding flagellar brake protein YcgR
MIYNIFKKQKERRRFKRCQVNLPVQVCYFGKVSSDSAKDISEGGLLLHSKNDYNVGGYIHVCFAMDGESSVIAKAEVIYKAQDVNDGALFGLRFLDLPPSLRQDIQKMM